MKKGSFILMLLLTLQSCYKAEDDTKEICQSDCTIVEGTFVSFNKEPIKNVRISLDYKISTPPIGSQIRKIRNVKTNANGYYKMEFHIKDDELGQLAPGYFKYNIDASELDHKKYLIPSNIVLGDAFYSINRRDTIIHRSCYFPLKTFIKVNLNNFTPIHETDFFEVRTLFPFGFKIDQNDFLDTEYQTGMSGYGIFKASVSNNTFENVYVAQNETNVIRIIRRKNGLTTSEDFKIFIPKNNTIELSYEY